MEVAMANETTKRRRPAAPKRAPEDFHESRPVFRFTKTMCLKLCAPGHVLGGWELGPNFAGSAGEAEASRRDPPPERCYGTLPPVEGA
jgi:hypothetical protein